MNVLVTGAGGFLGRSVIDQLVERGHRVRAMVRPASRVPNWPKEVESYRADLRSNDDLVSAFSGIDAVLHLAAAVSGSEDTQFASTVVGTENLLGAMAKSATKRLIHVSSFAVYDWSQAHGVLDETSPVLSDPYRMGGYTIAKVWQERIVIRAAQKNSWELTIARPGFIWGPEHAEIAGMGRHAGRVYIMFGPFTRLPLSHVTNCANCLVCAVEKPAAASGQTFNIVDGDDIRVKRYVGEYTRHINERAIRLPVPYWVGYGVARLALFTSKTLFGDRGKLPSLLTPCRFEAQFKPLRFSNRKVREALGWVPPLTFEECVKATYGA
jgi:nucleoside-diphosphate-sugar epimerase